MSENQNDKKQKGAENGQATVDRKAVYDLQRAADALTSLERERVAAQAEAQVKVAIQQGVETRQSLKFFFGELLPDMVKDGFKMAPYCAEQVGAAEVAYAKARVQVAQYELEAAKLQAERSALFIQTARAGGGKIFFAPEDGTNKLVEIGSTDGAMPNAKPNGEEQPSA